METNPYLHYLPMRKIKDKILDLFFGWIVAPIGYVLTFLYLSIFMIPIILLRIILHPFIVRDPYVIKEIKEGTRIFTLWEDIVCLVCMVHEQSAKI